MKYILVHAKNLNHFGGSLNTMETKSAQLTTKQTEREPEQERKLIITNNDKVESDIRNKLEEQYNTINSAIQKNIQLHLKLTNQYYSNPDLEEQKKAQIEQFITQLNEKHYNLSDTIYKLNTAFSKYIADIKKNYHTSNITIINIEELNENPNQKEAKEQYNTIIVENNTFNDAIKQEFPDIFDEE